MFINGLFRTLSLSLSLSLPPISGKCGVMCSVVGPAEVRLHKDELLDKAAISVNFKSLVGMTSTRERMYERLLRDTAEHLIHSKQFPRTNIQIVVQVVADDGCVRKKCMGDLIFEITNIYIQVLSAAMNAMVLALIDAGIPLRGMAGSISCCVDHQGEILLDPTSAELNVS